MNLSDDQILLRDTVRSVLFRRSDGTVAHEADPELWSVLCGQIGVAGLAVPESCGGTGATLLDILVVAEELGRALTPTPLLGSVLTAETLLALGDTEAVERLLPGIAAGQVVALAWAGPGGRWDPTATACTARPSDGHWTLDGEAHYVLDGELAETLLVAAQVEDGIGLFEVTPAQDGVRRDLASTMDETRRLATVRLSGAVGRRVGADASAALARARDVACVVLAGEQVGAASRALELTVEYTKVRHQFGRPIGGFQALKHRMADLFVLAETARSACYGAASAASGADFPMLAAVAGTYCSEALSRTAAEMIQLHGGIAITWEHDAHRYFKRAHGSALLFGSPSDHLNRLAAVVGLP